MNFKLSIYVFLLSFVDCMRQAEAEKRLWDRFNTHENPMVRSFVWSTYNHGG